MLSLAGANGLRLATAESCTGGMVAARLTSVPGSSASFVGGVVAYADEVKRSELDVPEELLAEHGAVSAEVAAAMAEGARQRLGADVAVAVTGVAGPGGGTPEKPVGRVYLHAAGPDGFAGSHARPARGARAGAGAGDRHGAPSPACASDGKSRRIRMSSAASVSGDERLRLFLALRLPDDVLDEVERWQREQLPGVRVVPREHLHITLAFLGHRPAGELESIVGALRDAAAGAGEIRLTPSATARRGAPACSSSRTTEGNAALLAGDVQERLERLGVYRAKAGPGCRTSRWRAGAGGQGSGSSLRRYERSFRPTRLLTYPGCTRAGRGYEVLESVALGG